MNKYSIILLLVVITIVCSGCAVFERLLSSDDDYEFDSQPWNKPAAWENQVYGPQF
ncbi:MAG: hypothetical protein ACRC37_04610 [Lentisphaeria bacterium]